MSQNNNLPNAATIGAIVTAAATLFDCAIKYKNASEDARNQRKSNLLEAQESLTRMAEQRTIIVKLIEEESKTKRQTLNNWFKTLNKCVERGDINAAMLAINQIEAESKRSIAQSVMGNNQFLESNKNNKTLKLK